MQRRDVLAGSAALAGLGLLSPARLAAAAAATGEPSPTTLAWPDLGTDWTDGLPVANGQLGAMVWLMDGEVTISLDRVDLWDVRPIPEFAEPGFTYANLVALRDAGNTTEIARLFEKPFHKPGAGKLPAGRIRTGIKAAEVRGSALDLARAAAMVTLIDGTILTVRVMAGDDLGVIEASGPGAARVLDAARVDPPPYGQPPVTPAKPSPLDYGGAADLGYARTDLASPGRTGYAAARQGAAFAVLAARAGSGPLVWTIEPGRSAAEAGAAAAARLGRADISAARRRHEDWWRSYWQRVALDAGDAGLNGRWRRTSYHQGAAMRAGKPPVPLQSPWTWDNGRLPAWKGDYHHDLNTQMTYWPVYTGNRPDQSANFVDWLWATREEARRYTRAFFGVEGLNYPGTADLLNRPLGGWAAYSYSPTVSAWLLQHFDLHWRLFGDAAYLRDRAYPFAREVTTFLTAMLRERPGRTGVFLPMSISPEINDNKLASFFAEWTNFDLALVRYAFTTAACMADAAGRADEARRYRTMLGRLPDFARDDDGGLSVAPGQSLSASHRHFSHLLAFYPLRLLDPATDPAAAKSLDASLARLELFGTRMWMGYSFAWLAALYALAGRGADALRALRLFELGFSGRNGFHTNGDRSGKGITDFPFSLFTLEGGNAASAAVQDMLLQSGDGWLRLFPAAASPGARFERLRASGGIDVSARLAGGQLAEATLIATRRVTVRVEGPGLTPREVQLMPGRPLRVTGSN